ncbi:MAG: hypothetical protein Q8S17_09810, partial [Humidesulfovibrio sp.]|nr:hypothetical protein [Humidesulfovibrio sp.]
PTYDLSCDNVARIRIGRLDDTYYNVESYQGHFHVVVFDLKQQARAQFAPLVDNAPWVTFVYRGEEARKQHIDLTTHGRPLRDDAPSISGFSHESINITIIREKDAFDAARAVCPALVPRKVIVDWERDWEPGWERREYK